MTLIAMTAASALVLGFSTSAFAAGCDTNCLNHHTNVVVNSSLFNVGGQINGSHSVSGVLNSKMRLAAAPRRSIATPPQFLSSKSEQCCKQWTAWSRDQAVIS